jgi:hypothetical protein
MRRSMRLRQGTPPCCGATSAVRAQWRGECSTRQGHRDHGRDGGRQVHRGRAAGPPAVAVSPHPRRRLPQDGRERAGRHDAGRDRGGDGTATSALRAGRPDGRPYAVAGFDAVVQDVIIGSELERFVAQITSPRRYLVVLSPVSPPWSGVRSSAPRRATFTSPPVRWTRCCGGRPHRSATGSTPVRRLRRRRSRTSCQPRPGRRLSRTRPDYHHRGCGAQRRRRGGSGSPRTRPATVSCLAQR